MNLSGKSLRKWIFFNPVAVQFSHCVSCAAAVFRLPLFFISLAAHPARARSSSPHYGIYFNVGSSLGPTSATVVHTISTIPRFAYYIKRRNTKRKKAVQLVLISVIWSMCFSKQQQNAMDQHTAALTLSTVRPIAAAQTKIKRERARRVWEAKEQMKTRIVDVLGACVLQNGTNRMCDSRRGICECERMDP